MSGKFVPGIGSEVARIAYQKPGSAGYMEALGKATMEELEYCLQHDKRKKSRDYVAAEIRKRWRVRHPHPAPEGGRSVSIRHLDKPWDYPEGRDESESKDHSSM